MTNSDIDSAIKILTDELADSRNEIKEMEHRFNNLIRSSASMIAVFKGQDMIVEIANDAIIETWGKGKDVFGKSLFEVLPEIIEQGFVEIFNDVYTTGETYYAYAVPVNLTKNGKLELFHYTFTYEAHRNTNGEVKWVSIVANEVSPEVLLNQKLEEGTIALKQSNKNLESKAVQLSEAQQMGQVGNWEWDVLSNKITWSDELYRIYGLLPQEIQLDYQRFIDFIHPDDKEYIIRTVQQALLGQQPYTIFYKIVRKDGTIRMLNGTGTVLTDNQKNTIKLSGWVHDFTEKKMASEHAYSRSLIEASLDPLVVIGLDGKITDTNEAMETITGKTRDELKNTEFKNYFTDPKKSQQIYQEVFERGFVTNYPLTMKDHVLTDVLFNGSVYKDELGNVLGAVVVARDISEQKKIQKEINEARILAELATTIAEELQGKAEEAVRSKQQFLSNMSHEIRTPMNAIIGFTKVVLKTDLTAKQKEYLTAIKMSGDALILLINDILDLAKVDAGKMTFEQTPFRMAVSMSAILHLFETKIQEKNLKLTKKYDHTIPEIVIGDPARLNQIMLNLISNAVKFTNKGEIRITIKKLTEDNDNVCVEFAVIDTGIGIAKDKIGQIFDNFQQATTGTSRVYGGTGLGLAIAKQLVEAQGGTIKVKSKVDKGSVFSFSLNFQKTNTTMELAKDILEIDTEIKNLKILVVEDMPLNQLLMRTLLDDFGFECDISANGKIAIEKLQTKQYDLVLMDLQMPEMNGFEATEYIRQVMKSDIPIVALTADVTTTDVAKCKAVGMNDYIAKPVDEQILYDKIIKLVKKNVVEKSVKINTVEAKIVDKIRHTDLEYLNKRTKSNHKLIAEMISIFLEQTPPLIQSMKQSIVDKDWQLLNSSVHKIIPSFSIMGMNADFSIMTKKIQEYATTQIQQNDIQDIVSELENACTQVYEELREELNKYQ